MYWLQTYANFAPRKSCSDIGYKGIGFNKKVLRSRGISAHHALHYLETRLPTIQSVNNFSAQRYATHNPYHLEALLTINIGSS
jgi:hypothetical protein